jgi:outer membrane protein TolC
MRNWEKSSLAFALVFGFAMTARSQPVAPKSAPAAVAARRNQAVAPVPQSTAPEAIGPQVTPATGPVNAATTPTQTGVSAANALQLGLPEEATVEPLPLPPAPTMTFEEAIRQSVLRNASAQVANFEIQRFEAVARQTRAGWLPTFTANGTFAVLDNDRRFSGRVFASQSQLSANLTLNVPIIAPQQWAASSRASDQIDIARASRADVARTVAITVAKAYLLVVSQKRVLEVSRSARVTALAHYEFSRTRFVGGLGNKVDVVRAAQELAADDGIVEQARVSVVRAREALGTLIGAQTPVDAVEPALAGAPTQEAALTEVESQRTDVQAQKNRMQAAKHSSSLNYTEYLPYLNAIAQPFYQHPASIVTPTTGWQAQLVLSIPLYDGGARYGRAAERAVVSNEVEATLDGLLRQARSEVRTAFSAVMSTEATLSSNRRAARLAEQALQLAMLAYRAGATGNLEVIDAERRARDASIQVAAAEDALRQARLDLLAASGRFPSAESK